MKAATRLALQVSYIHPNREWGSFVAHAESIYTTILGHHMFSHPVYRITAN